MIADHLLTDKLLASLQLPQLSMKLRPGIKFGHHFLFALPMAPIGGRVTFASLDERSELTAIGPEGKVTIRVDSTDDLHIIESDRKEVAPKVTGRTAVVFDTRRGQLVSSRRKVTVTWGGATFERTDDATLMK